PPIAPIAFVTPEALRAACALADVWMEPVQRRQPGDGGEGATSAFYENAIRLARRRPIGLERLYQAIRRDRPELPWDVLKPLEPLPALVGTYPDDGREVLGIPGQATLTALPDVIGHYDAISRGLEDVAEHIRGLLAISDRDPNEDRMADVE